MKTTLFLLLLFLFSSVILIAQTDIEGSKDHPLVSRYPDSYISYYEEIKFIEYDLAIGPVTAYKFIENREKIGGQVTRIFYQIEATSEEVSVSEVYLDYVKAFEKEKITILAKGSFPIRNVKKEVGGMSWIGVALEPNAFPNGAAPSLMFAGTSTIGGSFSIIGQLEQPNGQSVYIAIYGKRHSDKEIMYHIDIVEVKGAETGQIAIDPDYIQKEIDAKGAVSIYGILFDFNKSTLKPGSDSTLLIIAEYMNKNPEVNLIVVGHTDMKGSLDYNMKLSGERALAVKNALVNKHGINQDRLSTNGVGYLSPKSNNTTENGRALNRRVELVKKI